MYPICLDDWVELFVPLSKEGMTAWLQREDRLRLPVTTDGLSNLVWKWVLDYPIVDLKVYKTNKTNVEAMILQLLAAQFIATKDKSDGVYWTIVREESKDAYPLYWCINGDHWIGVHLLPTGHQRPINPTLYISDRNFTKNNSLDTNQSLDNSNTVCR